MIGQIIRDYKIEESSTGADGAVYKGVVTMLGREVAIKALKPELASQTSVVRQLHSEAVTLAKLNPLRRHALHDVSPGRKSFVVSPNLSAVRTLGTILRRHWCTAHRRGRSRFLSKVLDGIDPSRHELGIVHRDVSP